MSYAIGTTNYNLPLTQGSDKRDWSDTNQAFTDVDAAIKTASDDSTLALSAAQTAQTSADGAVADAASAVSTANAAASQAATASEMASLARTEAQSAVTTAGQAQTTAQAAQTTATNADTVALAAQSAVGNLSNLTTTDKTSAVSAINEVNANLNANTLLPKITVTNNTYVLENDGYLTVSTDGSSGSSGYAIVSDANDLNFINLFVQGTAPRTNALYLKKGMKVTKSATSGTVNVEVYILA